MNRYLCIALLVLLASPATTFAKSPPDVTQLTSAPTALDPDKAYLLFRSSRAKSGMFAIENVLLRIPEQAETEAFYAAKKLAFEKALPGLRKKQKDGTEPVIEQFPFEYDGPPNAFATKSSDFLVDGEVERTFLIEVPEGIYVLYGIAVGSRAIATCNCLGTVRFRAEKGVITQLGTLYADKVHKPSDIPHLEDNRGASMFQYSFILGQALVPATAGTEVPESLQALPRVLARFEPVQPFLEPGAASINRLAPIPGILEYDRGRVIALKKSAPVETPVAN